MRRIEKTLLVVLTLLCFGFVRDSHAVPPNDPAFSEIPWAWEHFDEYGDPGNPLDWSDADDDSNTDSTDLGFSVNIGGALYDHFDMDSNGYVELLAGSTSPAGHTYDYISGLTSDHPSSTYLLAAYDDLSSDDYGYYGYALFSERAVFYYDTETYDDEDDDLLNNFEMVLYKNGDVQWNFNNADYYDYGYDLYSGLYFGNTGTLLELEKDDIPVEKSFYYQNTPEPASLSLLGFGLLGAIGAGFRKRR